LSQDSIKFELLGLELFKATPDHDHPKCALGPIFYPTSTLIYLPLAMNWVIRFCTETKKMAGLSDTSAKSFRTFFLVYSQVNTTIEVRITEDGG